MKLIQYCANWNVKLMSVTQKNKKIYFIYPFIHQLFRTQNKQIQQIGMLDVKCDYELWSSYTILLPHFCCNSKAFCLIFRRTFPCSSSLFCFISSAYQSVMIMSYSNLLNKINGGTRFKKMLEREIILLWKSCDFFNTS